MLVIAAMSGKLSSPLFICFGMTLVKVTSSASIIAVYSGATFVCSPGFLVAKNDTVTFKAKIRGNDSVYTLHGPDRPQYYITLTTGLKESVCSTFNETNGSCLIHTNSSGCLCRQLGAQGYELTYNFNVKYEHSEALLSLEWKNLINDLELTYIIPEVRETCPLKLVKFSLTKLCDYGYSVAGMDRVLLQFELIGFDSDYTWEAGHSAEIHHENSTGKRKVCPGFKPHCMGGKETSCTCEMTGWNMYMITYNSTVKRGDDQALYLVWPGDPGIMSHEYELGIVMDECSNTLAVITKGAIVASIGFIALTVAIVGFCWGFGRMREKDSDETTHKQITNTKFTVKPSSMAVQTPRSSTSVSVADSLASSAVDTENSSMTSVSSFETDNSWDEWE